jgi:hypothetical protein
VNLLTKVLTFADFFVCFVSVGESSTSQEAVKEPNFIVATKEMDNALNNQGSSNVNFILDENVQVEPIPRTPQMDENVVQPNLEVIHLPPAVSAELI